MKKEKITKTKTGKNKKVETPPKEKYHPNKLIIILGIILIIVIVASIIVNLTMKKENNQTEDTSTKEDEPIINTNEDIVKKYEIDGLTFTSTSLISQSGESYLTTEVKNTNNIDYQLKEIHITIKDKDGNYVISYQNENNEPINYLIGYIGEVIPAGETKNIITTIDQVITSDAHTIEYEIIK